MKRWFRYVKPYLPYFIIGPLCMIVEVIGEVLMPKMLSLVVTAGTATEQAAATLTVGRSIGIACGMIGIAIVMMLGGVGGAYFGAKASVNFAADLRADVYRKVQKFSFSNIDKFTSGSLLTRLTNDVTQLQNFVNMILRMALRSPGMMIGALIMAISIKPSLSLVFAVTVPILFLLVFGMIRVGFSRFSRMQKKIDTLNTTVQESITNVRVVKSFVREEQEKKKFGKANRELKEHGMNAVKVMICIQPVMTVLMNLTTLAVLVIGGRNVLIGGMEIGDLSAFLTYVTQILSSLMMISMLLMHSSRAMASGRRIREVLDESIDLHDENATQREKRVTRGEIKFKNVSFRYYKKSEGRVLNAIDLKIEAGSTVGIIGSTGCGKTTLVSMIPRLYDVDEGAVLVDGVDVRDYSLYNLREGVGMVLQKNVLFSGSIAENLRWGDESASDEQIKAAASSAAAHGFIESFADGYDTALGQGGSNVSGGQKQRLCIARALLKKPRILILDDSTSAVDTATEAEIRRAFREELRDTTKIIIAQRIGSVQHADQIIVMNEGCVTGIGTHDELLATNTEYREIYESQTDRRGA
ncbi:MAG: ABC transporter ATP-binding protein [Clostridia bacterium]|nr:ABC transporter ATP-binding protein [Clostridia bacterium]